MIFIVRSSVLISGQWSWPDALSALQDTSAPPQPLSHLPSARQEPTAPQVRPPKKAVSPATSARPGAQSGLSVRLAHIVQPVPPPKNSAPPEATARKAPQHQHHALKDITVLLELQRNLRVLLVTTVQPRRRSRSRVQLELTVLGKTRHRYPVRWARTAKPRAIIHLPARAQPTRPTHGPLPAWPVPPMTSAARVVSSGRRESLTVQVLHRLCSQES